MENEHRCANGIWLYVFTYWILWASNMIQIQLGQIGFIDCFPCFHTIYGIFNRNMETFEHFHIVIYIFHIFIAHIWALNLNINERSWSKGNKKKVCITRKGLHWDQWTLDIFFLVSKSKLLRSRLLLKLCDIKLSVIQHVNRNDFSTWHKNVVHTRNFWNWIELVFLHDFKSNHFTFV